MGASVIVVEDEPLIRMDAVSFLEEAGLQVAEFDSGDEALEYLKSHEDEVAAIFTDVNLKGEMDGIALASIASKIAPTALLIVTSGRVMDAADRLPRNARFLRKPWLPLQVLSAIQQAVDEREQVS